MFNSLADWLTFSVLNLDPATPLASAVQFFIFDATKILLLLAILMHAMSLLRAYLPFDGIRNFLTTKKMFGLEYFLAAIFGAVTPFCSCSSLSIFIAFVAARLPLGIAFAFLITSPLVNEVAVGIFWAAFGWQLTAVYVGLSLAIGVAGGVILGRMNLEKYLQPDIFAPAEDEQKKCNCGCQRKTFWQKLKLASREARGLIWKVLPWLLAGLAVGAAIHGFVPEEFFERTLSAAGIFGVPLAVVLAVPLYSNASAVVPILEVLVTKGVPFGTALAFMMATVGLSLPEAVILKKVMSVRLLAIFFGIVAAGIISIGYAVNFLAF